MEREPSLRVVHLQMDFMSGKEHERVCVCVRACVSARKGNVTAKWRSETLGTNDRKILHGNATFCFNFERKGRGKKESIRSLNIHPVLSTP